MQTVAKSAPKTGAIPRGIARTGPAILSYGFRPFFMLAGFWALFTMTAWIGALWLGWMPGGSYGAANWHAHELLFGYAGAALAGFMLTAIPNWTGRLPVSGLGLAALAGVWMAGRIALLAFDGLGPWLALGVESAFFPVLAIVALREIIAGRNTRNFHIPGGLVLLSLANVWFHVTAVTGGDVGAPERLAIAVWIVLIALIGGRMATSFTRNWLARQGSPRLPAPLGGYDHLALGSTALILIAWVVRPAGTLTGWLLVAIGMLHFWRLARWQGARVWTQPLILMLHIAYGFIALGLVALGFAALGLMNLVPAMHLITVGAIGGMTLAVMSRATRGHTGRALAASPLTLVSYGALVVAALSRPLADALPGQYLTLVGLSGLAWLVAYLAFVAEHLPMWVLPRAR